MYVFGGFGLVSWGISLLSAAFAFYRKFFDATSFIQTPLPLLSVMAFITGVLSMLMGLLAELLVRTYYESQQKRPYAIKHAANLELGRSGSEPEAFSSSIVRDGDEDPRRSNRARGVRAAPSLLPGGSEPEPAPPTAHRPPRARPRPRAGPPALPARAPGPRRRRSRTRAGAAAPRRRLRSRARAAAISLEELGERIKATPAIGTFSKLALKNDIDDLVDDLRGYHQHHEGDLHDLHQRYEALC
jgi:hypothetical protein